ncbi:MAG: hypothetical protein IJ668_11720 [Selenomonadaceae bacterium]|nr:hypothetical protein [Selenomonadaceae bacterium]
MILAFSMSMFEEKKKAPSMRSIAAKEILYLMLSVTSVMLAITILSAVFDLRMALIQCMVFYTLPAFLLSGYIWSEQGMIEPIRLISIIQPVHYILMDFRAMALVGTSENFVEHVALFIAIGFGALLIAMLIRVRWSKAVSTCNHTARD